MITLVHELISHSAQSTPNAIALQAKSTQLNYQTLTQAIQEVACSYTNLGINQGDRIGIYLAKTIENVSCTFACSILGAVFVPINPVLKSAQVEHIISDCQLKCLISNKARLASLSPILSKLPNLTKLIIIDATNEEVETLQLKTKKTVINWAGFLALSSDNSSLNTNTAKKT